MYWEINQGSRRLGRIPEVDLLFIRIADEYVHATHSNDIAIYLIKLKMTKLSDYCSRMKGSPHMYIETRKAFAVNPL